MVRKLFSMETKNFLHGKKKVSPWKKKLSTMEKNRTMARLKIKNGR